MLVALPVLLRAYQAEVESLFFKTQPFTALIRNDNIKKKALCRERCASQNLEVCASCLLGSAFTTLGQAPSLALLCILLPAAGESKKGSENHTPTLKLCTPSTPLSEQPSSPAAQLFLFAVSLAVQASPWPPFLQQGTAPSTCFLLLSTLCSEAGFIFAGEICLFSLQISDLNQA